MENLNLPVWEIKSVCEKHGMDTDSLWNEVLRRIKLSSIERAAKVGKRSGASVLTLLETAIAAKLFVIGSVLGFFARKLTKVDFEKTALYRFFQHSHVDWRGALYDVNRQLGANRKDGEAPLPKVCILDDSTLDKTGKRIEGVSYVHDHVGKRWVLGFKLLALAWFDGYTCRVLDTALVKEKSGWLKKITGKFRKKRDATSCGAKRKAEMAKDKISLAISMLKRAVRKGFIPDIVQTDSWFSCLKLIKAVRALANGSVHFLGMIKFGTRNFEWAGKSLNLTGLRRANMGNAKRCRRFNSRYIQIDCILPGLGAVRIFISRYAGSKKWVALLTTDMTMSYVKAIETYMIRWNIEICFKETKQILGLEKCQARDFDSQIAHIALVFMAHALLVDMKAREEYKSLGALFEALGDQRRTALVTERLLALFEEFLRTAADSLGGLGNVSVKELLESDVFDMFKKILLGTLTDFIENWNPPQVSESEVEAA